MRDGVLSCRGRHAGILHVHRRRRPWVHGGGLPGRLVRRVRATTRRRCRGHGRRPLRPDAPAALLEAPDLRLQLVVHGIGGSLVVQKIRADLCHGLVDPRNLILQPEHLTPVVGVAHHQPVLQHLQAIVELGEAHRCVPVCPVARSPGDLNLVVRHLDVVLDLNEGRLEMLMGLRIRPFQSLQLGGRAGQALPQHVDVLHHFVVSLRLQLYQVGDLAEGTGELLP
mmetsp:Transcript_61041/g.175089  ORF Transcript_61041/g.175089 Transcript_61041/m.175089 type:complete len:225 (+) Transcript_61041:365-1039(+)